MAGAVSQLIKELEMTFVDTDTDLSKLKKAEQWRRDHAPSLFGSSGSWAWFKRMHRDELIQSGALIVRSGRAGDLVHIDRIGPVVQRILQAESQMKVQSKFTL